MNIDELVKEYEEERRVADYYNHMLKLMNWDLRARAPKGSVETKVETIKYFSGLLFKKSIDPHYGELLNNLSEAIKSGTLDKGIAFNMTVERDLEGYNKYKAVPPKFQEEFTVTRAKCERAWEEARANSDYAMFAPWLEKNIAMTSEQVSYTDPDKDAYDALLFRTEKGLSSSDIEKLFDEVRRGIQPVVDRVKGKELPKVKADLLTAEPHVMEQVQKYLLNYIGFDANRGTTGDTPHALTGPVDKNDIRITNRLYGRHPLDICSSAIHEGGHAIYFQNVNPEYYDYAPGKLIYADIHESQSRFYENILGRDEAFWQPIYGDLVKMWPDLKEYTPCDIAEYMNRVCATEIRTSADELTYCMHIILRYEMELMMFRDHASVYDLPEIWNSKMKEFLGVTPRDDAHGILQDLHWSSVYLGYFPTYLLGSIYDGMFLDTATKELGDISQVLSEGRIGDITKWLNRNIHFCGSLYNAPELIENVCKTEIKAEPLIRYFNKKYN